MKNTLHSPLRRRGLAMLASVPLLALAPALWAAPSSAVRGEVRRVDAASGRITIKHGPIPELELPAMTLVYRVQDPALLAQVKPGDTVTFTADRVDDQYVIISLKR